MTSRLATVVASALAVAALTQRPASGQVPSPSPHMKRTPRVKLTWGATKPTPARRLTGTVVATTRVKGRTYIKVDLVEHYKGEKKPAHAYERTGRLFLSQSPYGVAVRQESQLLARIVGTFDRPVTFTFGSEKGGRGRLSIGPNPKAATDPGLVQEFFKAFADRARAATAYARFERGRSLLLAGESGHLKDGELPVGPTSRTPLGETMQLYTGMASVDEALQADRGLRLPRGKNADASIALSTLEGVPLAAHPWKKMIADSGKKPVVEPLSERVPVDVLYVHFRDIRTALNVGEDVWRWLTPLAQALENKPGDHRLGERYQTMLMLESTAVAKTAGHLAVAGVALVADDPFLRDGASVAVLFHTKNTPAVLKQLNAQKASYLAKYPGARSSTYTLGSHTVALTALPRVPIEQHRLVVGDDLVVVANSRPLLERIVAVNAKKATALASSGDFRYMRTLYPYGPKAEDGFLFIGDAFVAKTVGPRAKILQSRRVRARADIQAVGFASLMHGLLEGAPPTSVKALIASGFASEADFKHANGQPISLDPARGAHSEWGSLRHMRSLDQVALEKVTPAEKEAYEAFRKTYQSYWTTFIDPIGVRLVRSPDGKQLEVDARMLPLIETSAYSNLVEQVGSVTFTPPVLGNALQWTAAIGENSWLRRLQADQDLGFDWIGDWFMVGSAGHGGAWDYAANQGEIAALRGGGKASGWFGGLVDAPFYLGLHLRSPLAARAALNDLEASVRGSKLVRMRKGFSYKGIQVLAMEAADKTQKHFLVGQVPFTIYLTAVDDVLLLSLDASTLRWLVDHAKAGRLASKAVHEAPRQAEFRVHASPGGWVHRTLAATAESSARKALRRGYYDAAVLFRGLGAKPSAGFAQAAMGFLGYVPQSAQGGGFAADAEFGASHSRYGLLEAPRYPQLPSSSGALSALVLSLQELSMGLSFEGKGVSRGLHTTLRWRRR